MTISNKGFKQIKVKCSLNCTLFHLNKTLLTAKPTTRIPKRMTRPRVRKTWDPASVCGTAVGGRVVVVGVDVVVGRVVVVRNVVVVVFRVVDFSIFFVVLRAIFVRLRMLSMVPVWMVLTLTIC